MTQKFTKVCPNCAQEIELIYQNSAFCSCTYCASIIALNAAKPEKAILAKNKRKGYPTRRFLSIGQQFTFQEITYKITGRAVIKVNYLLPNEKENNTGTHTYVEWFCKSENADYLSITEDATGFNISRPEKPDDDIEEYFSGNYMRIFSDMNFRRFEETGEGKVLYFEGEADDNYYPGRQISYATCLYQGYTYGAEWNPFKPNVSVSFYVQNSITVAQFLGMIKKENDLSAHYAKLKEFNFFRGSFIVGTIAILFFIFFSLGYNGDTIYSTSTNITDIPEAGLELPQFEIKELNQTYGLKIETHLSSGNTEALIAVEINNSNGNVINLFEKWFWTASGVTDGGSWSEKETELTSFLNIEEKGSYKPVVFLEKTILSKISSTDFVTISINKGMYLTRYFVVLFIIFIIILIALYSTDTAHFVKFWYFKLIDK